MVDNSQQKCTYNKVNGYSDKIWAKEEAWECDQSSPKLIQLSVKYGKEQLIGLQGVK